MSRVNTKQTIESILDACARDTLVTVSAGGCACEWIRIDGGWHFVGDTDVLSACGYTAKQLLAMTEGSDVTIDFIRHCETKVDSISGAHRLDRGF